MIRKKVLFSFVGSHDPFSDDEGTLGPVLSLLEAKAFDEVNLVWTGTRYYEIAKMVEKECNERFPGPKFLFHPMELEHVIDYEEIYAKMIILGDRAKERHNEGAEFSILLDPGTPQMQTCWFLLARSGRFPATLLQGIPPRFTGGVYRVREVEATSEILPKIGALAGGPGKLRRTVTGEGLPERTIISGKTEQVFVLAEHFAQYDMSVLILGDTGTGKEVLARFIHEKSSRYNGPFLEVNCAGLGTELAESVLFGHKKGSFTGAVADKPGLFKAADGGILFLDEIGELPLQIQPKLLRALENKTFIPLGASKNESSDTRIICATHRDLKDMVSKGTFREDLYQRLNQLPLAIPPLRERREDIPRFIDLFLDDWSRQFGGGRVKHISPEAVALLLDYPWPGNIRELRNMLFQMCAVSLAEDIRPEHLPRDIQHHFKRKPTYEGLTVDIPDEGLDLKALLFNIEESYYRRALDKTSGNRERAARLLGINPPAFRKALKERFSL